MTPMMLRLGPPLALVMLAGCDPNPEGPRVPADAISKASAAGPTTPGKPAHPPVTKNPREILGPD